MRGHAWNPVLAEAAVEAVLVDIIIEADGAAGARESMRQDVQESRERSRTAHSQTLDDRVRRRSPPTVLHKVAARIARAKRNGRCKGVFRC